MKNKMIDRDFAPVGRCIYCGACEHLQDEHVIPYGLRGTLVLPQASCKKCAKITAVIEQRVLRDMYGFFRNKVNFPTRHRKNRRKHFSTSAVTHTGEKVTITLPLANMPGIVPFAHFYPPGLLRNPPVYEVPHPVMKWTAARLKWDAGTLTSTYKAVATVPTLIDPQSLARMLAKIAHAYCVGLYGIDSFEHWLLPTILESDLNYGYLVGGTPVDLPLRLDPLPNAIQIGAGTYFCDGQEIIIAQIWYFAEAGNSSNCVVVGSVTDKFPR